MARPHLPTLFSRAQAKVGGGGRGAPHTLPPGGPEGFFSNSPELRDRSLWSRDPRPCLSHLLLGTVAHACHMSKAGEGHPAPSLRPRAHLLLQGPSAATQPTLCPLLRCTALTGFKSHLLDLRVQGQKWLRCHRVLRLPLHTEVFPRCSGPRHPLPRAARSLVTAGHSKPAGV